MKLSLSVLERLLVLNMLPLEDSIITIKLIRKIKEDIGFSDAELKALDFKQVPHDGKNSTVWADGKVGEKEIDLGEKAVDIITEALKKLDKEKKLTESHVSLYDKVIK